MKFSFYFLPVVLAIILCGTVVKAQDNYLSPSAYEVKRGALIEQLTALERRIAENPNEVKYRTQYADKTIKLIKAYRSALEGFYKGTPREDSLLEHYENQAIQYNAQTVGNNPTLNVARTQSLLALGRIYYNDPDTLYLARTLKTLINEGYRFPYLAGGASLAPMYGKNLALDISATIGIFNPANKTARQYSRYGGVLLGYEYTQGTSLGGFKIGGVFNAWPFSFGLNYVILRTGTYVSNTDGEKVGYVGASYLRPEIGYNIGWAGLYAGYNIPFSNRRYDAAYLSRFYRDVNRIQVGLRFNLVTRIGSKPQPADFYFYEYGDYLSRKH